MPIVSPMGRGVIVELAPDLQCSQGALCGGGFLSYLIPSMTGREQSLRTVRNKGKCRTSLLLPVLLCEPGRAELRFFLHRGKESKWEEEKELALLLAFQSRNGLYLLLFRTEQSLVPWDSKEQGKGERGSTTSTALQDWESAQNWF